MSFPSLRGSALLSSLNWGKIIRLESTRTATTTTLTCMNNSMPILTVIKELKKVCTLLDFCVKKLLKR